MVGSETFILQLAMSERSAHQVYSCVPSNLQLAKQQDYISTTQPNIKPDLRVKLDTLKAID